jgi:hypothetical protein
MEYVDGQTLSALRVEKGNKASAGGKQIRWKSGGCLV